MQSQPVAKRTHVAASSPQTQGDTQLGLNTTILRDVRQHTAW